MYLIKSGSSGLLHKVSDTQILMLQHHDTSDAYIDSYNPITGVVTTLNTNILPTLWYKAGTCMAVVNDQILLLIESLDPNFTTSVYKLPLAGGAWTLLGSNNDCRDFYGLKSPGYSSYKTTEYVYFAGGPALIKIKISDWSFAATSKWVFDIRKFGDNVYTIESPDDATLPKIYKYNLELTNPVVVADIPTSSWILRYVFASISGATLAILSDQCSYVLDVTTLKRATFCASHLTPIVHQNEGYDDIIELFDYTVSNYAQDHSSVHSELQYDKANNLLYFDNTINELSFINSVRSYIFWKGYLLALGEYEDYKSIFRSGIWLLSISTSTNIALKYDKNTMYLIFAAIAVGGYILYKKYVKKNKTTNDETGYSW